MRVEEVEDVSWLFKYWNSTNNISMFVLYTVQ